MKSLFVKMILTYSVKIVVKLILFEKFRVQFLLERRLKDNQACTSHKLWRKKKTGYQERFTVAK